MSPILFARFPVGALHWLHLSGVLLMALLQRLPVLRVTAANVEFGLRAPAATLLKSALAAVGALGSVHALTGATTLSASTPSPASVTAGAPKTIVFAVLGAETSAASWSVAGNVPPGLVFTGGVTSGVVNTSSGVLTLSGTPTLMGTFLMTLRGWENANASGASSPVFLYTVIVSGGAASSAPAFSTQPVSQSVTAGGNATFVVAATGSPTPALQWQKNGGVIAGQTGTSLALSAVQPAEAGSYTCVARNSAGSVTSTAAVLTVNPIVGPSPESRISNVSVRTTLAAAQTLIVGFTMQGGAKLVVLRAVGPGLASFGVSGTMADPKLLLFKEAAMLTQNDDWGGGASLSTAFAGVGAFPIAPASRDAALMRSVEGGHTVQVSGPTGGNVLVEAYDAGAGMAPRLSNVSARNFVGTGSDILIAGITVAGSAPKALLIRAVGPTLAAFGVPGTLIDPTLTIYNAAGAVVGENDNWNTNLAGTFASVGAFALASGSKDAALTITLPPGGYTVQVAGGSGGTGEALVEIYELP